MCTDYMIYILLIIIKLFLYITPTLETEKDPKIETDRNNETEKLKTIESHKRCLELHGMY